MIKAPRSIGSGKWQDNGHSICTKAKLSSEPTAMPTLNEAAIMDAASSFSCCLTLLQK